MSLRGCARTVRQVQQRVLVKRRQAEQMRCSPANDSNCLASPSDKTPPRSGGKIFGNNQTRREAAENFRITRPRREAAEKFRSYKTPVFSPLEGPFEGFFVPKFGTLLFRKLGMVRRHLFILAAMQQTFSCLHLYFMTLRVTNPTNDVLRPITERSRKIQTSKNRNPATLPQRTNPLTPSPCC